MTSAESPRVEIADAPDEGAYVVTVDGNRAGKAEYLMRHGRHVFIHTEVDAEYSGMGLASRLVRYALDDVRRQNGRVVPLCPFVSAFIRRNAEYDDLVDHEMTMRLKVRAQ